MNIRQILREEINKVSGNQPLKEGYDDVSMNYILKKKKLSDYPNFSDKIVIGNHTYIHIPESPSDFFLWGQVLVFDNADGTEIANASYGKEKEDSRLHASIDVRGDKRRQGIASNIYTWIEKLTGLKLYPDTPHSKSAEALWNNPKRTFGYDR